MPSPNDLWAIHDLLLAGYAGIFMKPNSTGAAQAKQIEVKHVEMDYVINGVNMDLI